MGEKTKMRLLLAAMDFLDRHRLTVRVLLRSISRIRFISKRLTVLAKAFMGQTAFEIHDVNLERGRISIGGVEEIIFGSRIVKELHSVLRSRLGEEGKKSALYDIGFNLCRWEVSTAMQGGRWAPPVLVPLMVNGTILQDVRTDPLTGRFFLRVMGMVSRLITDEGGWGHLEFDLESRPMRVLLSNSQEAAWLGPSEEPVCHLYAGIVAGYASAISGRDLHAREVECSAVGAPECVFELDA